MDHRDLDSLQAPRFCDSEKSFGCIRWWPASLVRAREHTAISAYVACIARFRMRTKL